MDRGAHESAVLQLAGDYDADDAITLADVALFQHCFAAADAMPDDVDTCLCVFDDNADGQVDLDDYSALHTALTAP